MAWRIHAAAAVVTALAAVSTQAQDRRPPALESISSLTCAFTVLATGTWQDGVPKAEIRPAKLALRFTNVNVADGTAEADLGFGTIHLVVRLSEGSLHFIQVGSSGPVYLTTVFSVSGTDNRLRAVHTRHEYTLVSMPGFTSRPEQYYGACEGVF